MKGARLQEVRGAPGGYEPARPACLLSASLAHKVQPLNSKPTRTRLGAEAPRAQGALAQLGVARLVAIKRTGGTSPEAPVALPVSSKAAVERRLSSSRGCRSSVPACRAPGPAPQMLALPQCVRGGCKFPATVHGEAEFTSPSPSIWGHMERPPGGAVRRARKRRWGQGEHKRGTESAKTPGRQGGGAAALWLGGPTPAPVRREEAPQTAPQTQRRAVRGAWRSPHPMRESSYVCGSRLCLRQEKLGAAIGKERREEPR